MAKFKAAPLADRNKRFSVAGAFGALAAAFAGKAAAQTAEAPAGFDPLSALGEIREVTQLADGTLQVVLESGKTIIVSAADFVVVGSEYFIAESAAAALLAVPGGLGAGAVFGGVGAVGAVGAVAAGGGGGGDDAPPVSPPPPPPPPAASPVFTSGTTATFAENGTGTVYTAAATDADSPTLTYSITGGADANRFTINATTGVVTFVTPPNFEAPADVGANNVYDLQITASDGTNTAVRSVSVTVTNVNDAAPVFTSGTTATFAENGEGTVYTATATDVDSASVTYAITGGADASRFTINASTGVVTFVTPPNFEAPADAGADNVYELQITASDGTNTSLRSVAVTVTNVDDAAPVFTSGTTATFAENGTGAAYTAAATDADSTSLTYSITGGADAARFTINAATGVVTFITPPNFEMPTDLSENNVYELQVTASDGTLSATQNVSVTVTNVNDVAPLFTSGSTATFAENGTGTVYTAAAVDSDSASLTYSITGGADAARFVINPTTGAVTFVAPPDFEVPTDSGANNVYDLQITASDGTNASVQSVAVTVTNVSEQTIISLASLSTAQGFIIQGDVAYNRAGFAVSSAGDVNGDGFEDVIVSAPFANGVGSESGDSYVLFGSAGGFGASVSGSQVIDLTTLGASQGFIIRGISGERSGYSASSAGDINGDGFDDLIIGAPTGNLGGGGSGQAYVVFGGSGTFGTAVSGRQVINVSTLSASQGFVIRGDLAYDRAGQSVASAGDVNGDGYDDLIVGASSADGGGGYSGNSYIVFGGSGTFGVATGGRQVLDLTNLVASQGFIIFGDESGDLSGISVDSAGDVNGDGFDDLIVGARNGDDGGANAGEAYVIFGEAGTFGVNAFGRDVVDLTTLSTSRGFVIQGAAASDVLGGWVGAAGDVNGDGFDDIIVGATANAGGGIAAGASYVVFGGSGGFGTIDGTGRQVVNVATLGASQGFIVQGANNYDLSGVSVSSAGDVNGDGFADLIIGALGSDLAGADAGTSYVVYGSANGFGSPDGSGRQVIDLETLDSRHGILITGGANTDLSGTAVSSAGDINGDGFDDLLVGASLGDLGGTSAGQAYVVFGGATGTESTVAVSRTGTGSADNFTGNAGDDTFTSIGANDVIRGGAGNDAISLSATGFADIDGGRGTDTLALAGTGQTLNLTGAGTARISSIEVIDVTGTGNNTVVLDQQAVFDLTEARSGGDATITIRGNAGDTADLGGTGGGFNANGTVTDGGITYTIYTNGNANVRVQTGVTVLSEPPPPAQEVDLSSLGASEGFIIVSDGSDDGLGYSVSSAGDFNGDGFDDIVVAVYGDDDGGTNAGAAYVIFGTASGFGTPTSGRNIVDLTTLSPSAGIVVIGASPFDTASSVSSAGDINGDGYDDLIVGAWQGDDGGGDAGEAYVVFGGSGTLGYTDSNGRMTIDLSTFDISSGFIIQGDEGGDRLGFSVSSAGDVNGDGFDDMIVGARLGDDGGTGAGEGYVIFGGAGTFGSDVSGRQVIDLSTLSASQGFIIQGDSALDYAGFAVSSAGDVNGDGFDDMIVGAPLGSNNGQYSGEAYIVFGGSGGFGTNVNGRQVIDLTTLSASQGFIVEGVDDTDFVGSSVASAGDINGDGFDDLIIGAYRADESGPQSGGAYIVFGTASGFGTPDGSGRQVIELSTLSAAEGFVIRPESTFGTLGRSVSAAGDVNGDGFGDLIVGATSANGANSISGEAYVIFGGANGFGTNVSGRQVLDLADLNTSQGFIIPGENGYDLFGRSVSSAGDINGDGFDDILVGAPTGDLNAANGGQAYVVFGGATGTESTVAVSRTGTGAADNFTGNAGNDAFTGIGAGDVVRGGAGNDTISLSSSGFADIDGGNGTDTLVLSGAGQTLDLRGAGYAGLSSIEVIDLAGAGNHTVILDRAAVLELAETNGFNGLPTVTIRGDAGDTVDLRGGFTFSGVTSEGGIDYIVYSNGSATVRAQDLLTVYDTGAAEDIGASPKAAYVAEPMGIASNWESAPAFEAAKLEVLEDQPLDLNSGLGGAAGGFDAGDVWTPAGFAIEGMEVIDVGAAELAIQREAQLAADLLLIDAALATQGN